MSSLNWEPEAGLAYKNIIHQSVALKSAVERILDILEQDPSNRLVRTKSLRTKTGYTIWKIPIRESLEDWSLLWIDDPEDANAVLIVYLGPASYGVPL
jgi:hypothetical protein